MTEDDPRLSADRIKQASETLLALDELAATVYGTQHSKAVEEGMACGDSAVAELVQDINKTWPTQLMLADGFGYCIALSLFANTLIACNRQDLAMIVAEAQTP